MPEHRLHDRCGCASLHAEAVTGGRPFTFSTSQRHFERDRPFAIDHLALEIDLEVAKKRIVATARIHVRRNDPEAEEIALDAVGFDLRSVKMDGKYLEHSYDGRTLSVALGKKITNATLDIVYAATPRRGLYFLEPDEHYPDRPRQVWSQCQEEDARHWFPCHDKPHVKMTTEITAHVPNGWHVLSNGEVVAADTPKEGRWTFHWKMSDPHPSYLVTLVAGEFAQLADQAGPVPLTYLVPRGREDDGKRTFARTSEMVTYFGELTRVRYPWNKYSQVVVSDFIFGGMENTTATTMYEHILLDERAAIDVTSDDLIAHELAHQWFGDYVTCRDWSEGWLNEGWATFMEHVWREKHLGRDEFEYGIKVDLDSYVGEAHARYRRPIVCQDYDAPLDLFDRHLYEKGGLVLHMLRADLGPDLFWRAVNVYLVKHARSVVETRDFVRALEETSGRSLGRFFDQWVYKPGHPEIEVSIGWEKGTLSVSAKQTQSSADGVPGAFELPLVIDVVDEEGKARRERVVATQRQESFAIPCAKRPAFVVVDPEMRILGEVRVKAPNAMLRAQLAKAPTARGRWLAAQALARADDAVSVQALTDRLADDKEFWGTRAECAAALGMIRARDCFEALSGATGVAHPKVRRAVADALGRFRTEGALAALRPLARQDPSYLVEAEAARALGKTRRSGALEPLLELLDRPSWYDVIRAGALDGLAALRDERAVEHLVALVRPGHSSRARRAAALALPKLASEKKAREILEQLLDDDDVLVRIDVARALADLADPRARGALRDRLESDLDPRVRRRIKETIRDLTSEPKRIVEGVRDDFDKLQAEHADLKSRLARLEARLAEGEPKPKAEAKKKGLKGARRKKGKR